MNKILSQTMDIVFSKYNTVIDEFKHRYNEIKLKYNEIKQNRNIALFLQSLPKEELQSLPKEELQSLPKEELQSLPKEELQSLPKEELSDGEIKQEIKEDDIDKFLTEQEIKKKIIDNINEKEKVLLSRPYYESPEITKQLQNYMRLQDQKNCTLYVTETCPKMVVGKDCDLFHNKMLKDQINHYLDNYNFPRLNYLQFLNCIKYTQGSCTSRKCKFVHDPKFKNTADFKYPCPELVQWGKCFNLECKWNHDDKYRGYNRGKKYNNCPFFNSEAGCKNPFCVFFHPFKLCANYFIRKKCYQSNCFSSHKLTKQCLYYTLNWKILLFMKYEGFKLPNSILDEIKPKDILYDHHRNINKRSPEQFYHNDFNKRVKSRSRSRDRLSYDYLYEHYIKTKHRKN